VCSVPNSIRSYNTTPFQDNKYVVVYGVDFIKKLI
jgi:hypothetical protein